MTENITEPETISQATAFALFEGSALGHEEAAAAISNLSDDEKWSFEGHVEGFMKAIQAIMAEAAEEQRVLLLESGRQFPEYKQDFTFADWANFVAMASDTKYEKLHYAHMFGFQNNKAILEHAREAIFGAGVSE